MKQIKISFWTIALVMLMSFLFSHCKLTGMLGGDAEEKEYIEIDASELDTDKYDSLSFYGINEGSDDTVWIYTWHKGESVREKLYYPDDLKGNFTIITIGMKDGKVVGAQSTGIGDTTSTDIEELLNTAPDEPKAPVPSDEAENRDTGLTLSWTASDPDSGDELSYIVFLSTSENPEDILDKPEEMTTRASGLKFETKYYWQVAASDGTDTTKGPVWEFTTKVEPTLTVKNPDGGEKLQVGSVDTLKWESTGEIDKVKLEYTVDGGDSWEVIASSLKNDSQFYAWTVPDSVSNNVKIKVSSLDGKVSDMSNEKFSIIPVPVTITVTYPSDAGIKWGAGIAGTITWESTGKLDAVNIKYTLNGEDWTTISEETPNDGSYSWTTVPDTTSKQAKIRISSLDKEVSDESDNAFELTREALTKTLTLSAPNGGEELVVGSEYTIEWTSEGGIGDVKLEYTTDGEKWTEISASTLNDFSFKWTVPDMASETVRVKISEADSAEINDVSDEVFTILPKTKTLELTYPTSSSVVLQAGTSTNITWTSAGDVGKVKLQYISDGDSWVTITDSTDNDGSFEWTVPDVESQTVKVRVSEASGSLQDESDGAFTITKAEVAQTLTLTVPNGGEEWKVGSVDTIQWEYTGEIKNVKLEYYVNGNWEMITDSASNILKYVWNVPNTVADSVKVRVSDNSSNTSDESDGTFSITGSGDNNLSKLEISVPGMTPAFNPSVTGYNVSVPYVKEKVTVTPTANDDNAKIMVNGQVVKSGDPSDSIALGVGLKAIAVEVIAQDGKIKVYEIVVKREASKEAKLSKLIVEGVDLSPDFVPDHFRYTATVGNEAGSAVIIPTAISSEAKVILNSVVVVSGESSGDLNLNVGENIFHLEVIAADQVTKEIYTVVITRSPSNDASLSSISFSTGSVTPDHHPDSLTYTINVENSVTTLSITPTPTQGDAVIKVGGSIINPETGTTMSLVLGVNSMIMEVTAPDGSTVRDYKLNVHRALSNIADLDSLLLTEGTLSPTYSKDVLEYTATVSNNVEMLTVTAKPTEPSASISINSDASGSRSRDVALNYGTNTINVEVIAPDGNANKVYSVIVTRALSTDASLNGLELSAGSSLSPAFRPDLYNYTMNVANTTTSTTVTATLNDSNATMDLDGTVIKSGIATDPISLIVGENSLVVTVIAQDENTSLRYTVTVTRPSNNANLSGLSVSPGTMTPTFNTATTNYNLSVPYSNNSVDVTATLEDSTATLQINNATAVSGQVFTINNLGNWNTVIPIDVTAQNTTSTMEYTITVYRDMWVSGYPTASTVTGSTARARLQLQAPGKVYVVAVPKGDAVPSSMQVINGQNSQGQSLLTRADTVSIENGNAEFIVQVEGLNASSDYDMYFVAEDASSSLQPTPSDISTTTDNTNPPNVPNSPSPANGADGRTTRETLSWAGGDPDADDVVYYTVYLDTANPPVAVVSSNKTPNYLQVDSLLSGEEYYWKIVAYDSKASSEGDVWKFTRNNLPNISNPSPSDSSTAVSLSPTLEWTGGDLDGDNVNYEIYMSTYSPPTQMIKSTTLTSHTVTGLNQLTTYYWYVKADDGVDAAVDSPIWVFITGSGGM
ncbi:MAG: cadherin-like beta sandwich domain-containing protein [Fibrobacteria bacterium]|nr:cadherin-like beta sandwich domain-containing protein [Fibrobacteria bacterium]